MDTSFLLTQTRCYQQAARLMAKGVSLSVALRSCLRPRRASLAHEQPAQNTGPNRRRRRIGIGPACSRRCRLPYTMVDTPEGILSSRATSNPQPPRSTTHV